MPRSQRLSFDEARRLVARAGRQIERQRWSDAVELLRQVESGIRRPPKQYHRVLAQLRAAGCSSQ